LEGSRGWVDFGIPYPIENRRLQQVGSAEKASAAQNEPKASRSPTPAAVQETRHPHLVKVLGNVLRADAVKVDPAVPVLSHGVGETKRWRRRWGRRRELERDRHKITSSGIQSSHQTRHTTTPLCPDKGKEQLDSLDATHNQPPSRPDKETDIETDTEIDKETDKEIDKETTHSLL